MINHTSRSPVGRTVFRRPMFRVAAYSLVCLLLFGVGAPLQAAVEVQQDASSLTLANGKVVLKIDKTKQWFSITDAATQEVVLDQASMTTDNIARKKFEWGGVWQATLSVQAMEDDFGKGQRVVVAWSIPTMATEPTYLFSYALYEGSGAVVMGFGMPEHPRLWYPIDGGATHGQRHPAARPEARCGNDLEWFGGV